VFSVYYEDYENNAGTVVFKWNSGTTFATVSSVASKTRATTGSIALTSSTHYQWYVEATDATGTTRAPATGYWTFDTVDLTPPTPITGLAVIHDGPSGSSSTQTRYLTTTATTVNGLAASSLNLANSATAGNWAPGASVQVHLGIRVWKRSSAGVETEITDGTVQALVHRTATGNGFQTATYTPTQTALATTDSIVVRVYGDTTTPPTNVRATFTTEQIGATQLDANQWTVQYWTRMANTAGGGPDWYWGTTTYDNNIAGFKWTAAASPLDHNTISWVKSADDGAGANDVMNYKIYRAALPSGPWTTLIATLPAGTQTYVDLNMGEADATLWWYVVRAIDTNSNEDTNTNAVQEPGGSPPYEITLTGKTAGSWVFVSFPSGLTGNIQDLLTDGGTEGDGLTTWDVAKWYNPQTAADPWKTYRVAGTANDMPSINNGMGFWIHLTANGGDQMLTLSSYAATPASTGITLNVGWNLVGLPSASTKLGSTLPGAVDILSVYSGSATYTDYINAAIDPIVLSNGNAYFMHSTAIVVWTVTNP
jgi:hypothetical protein